MSPRPPDILRKSHRHTERKDRATAKEDLRQEIPAAVDELDDKEEGQPAVDEEHDSDSKGG